MTRDSSQLHHPIHSSLSDEICLWRRRSENVDCWKISIQEGKELLHGLPPLPRFRRTTEDPSLEDFDSSSEADTKPELQEEYLWKINPLVTSIDKLNFNNNANVEGEWFINENLDLAYLSVLASDSVPWNTNTDVDSDPLSVIDALTSLYASIRSSFTVHEETSDTYGAYFEMLTKHKGQKLILFGRIESEVMTRGSSEDDFQSP